MVMTIDTLSLGDARRLVMAAEAKAAQIQVPSAIAVVDAGGNLLVFARMDGAWIGAIDIAIHKAFAARAFDMPTQDLARLAAPGKPLFGVQNTHDGRIVILGGGAPVKLGDAVVGAIGSSGGTADQDQAVVDAALAAFEEERSRHADYVPA
ncbi:MULTISPECIES: heme-binding protein [Sphingomonas]|uniref:GlcG/HbpS family heme-binding protein n=1 Tax=Sphingomonas TaxID=13687 RepID=UPI000927DA1C|nr:MULTISPECIES: heme-binding protein [Sphingomonas]MCW6528937.1 heme-binding protein [Sphingomonas lycopersici]OJU22559.1 MAG: cobalamin adenosyltransferase [Sphingomonas sp. 66-10]